MLPTSRNLLSRLCRSVPLVATSSRGYHENIVEHYENPRNVGALDKNDTSVGTVSCAPWACLLLFSFDSGVQVREHSTVESYRTQQSCTYIAFCSIFNCGFVITDRARIPLSSFQGLVGAPACGDVMKLQIKVDENGMITESKFKTFGCGSAIASSSVATEWIKGRSVDEVLSIKNTDIAAHLKLPPVKLHCSMLAEDAIKAAVADWKGQAGEE